MGPLKELGGIWSSQMVPTNYICSSLFKVGSIISKTFIKSGGYMVWVIHFGAWRCSDMNHDVLRPQNRTNLGIENLGRNIYWITNGNSFLDIDRLRHKLSSRVSVSESVIDSERQVIYLLFLFLVQKSILSWYNLIFDSNFSDSRFPNWGMPWNVVESRFILRLCFIIFAA